MPRSPLQAFGLVFLGGVVGTLVRALVLIASAPASRSLFQRAAWTHAIPWRLIVINTLGVFLAAYVLAGPLRDPRRSLVRAFVVPGILGGLTSYSAVFTDAHTLWTLEPVAAAVLVAGSVLVGVVAAWAGQRVAR